MNKPPHIMPARQLPSVIGACTGVNFFGQAFTPWHAVGIDATIRWMQSQGRDIKGVCLLHPDASYGLACGENAFVNNVSAYIPCEKPPRACGFLKYMASLCQLVISARRGKDDNETIYIASTYVSTRLGVMAWLSLKRRVRLITIDEGVGVYLGTFGAGVPRHDSLRSWVSFLGSIPGRMVTALKNKSLRVIDNRLFLRKGGSLTLNERMFPFYKSVIQEKAAKMAVACSGFSLERKILICTTAWERAAIADDEDYETLLKVCRYLHAKGFQLVLKPHPRDKFFQRRAKDMQAQLLQHSIPMEVICAISQPAAIISFSSTALITARLFWNIPAFCLSDLLDMSKLGDVYRKETSDFKRVFHAYVSFPKTVEDIGIPTPR